LIIAVQYMLDNPGQALDRYTFALLDRRRDWEREI
jgi:hypothetical protein